MEWNPAPTKVALSRCKILRHVALPMIAGLVVNRRQSDLRNIRYRSSYERGCQGKSSLPFPRGKPRLVTYIQPCLLRRGAFDVDVAALVRRVVQRRCHPQLMIPSCWFHVTVVLDASRLRSYASPALA